MGAERVGGDAVELRLGSEAREPAAARIRQGGITCQSARSSSPESTFVLQTRIKVDFDGRRFAEIHLSPP